jgi:hypothetical protein
MCSSNLQHTQVSEIGRYLAAVCLSPFLKIGLIFAFLKKNVILHQDSKAKANLLNDQFKSVFTREDTSERLPNMGDLKYSSIENIKIECKGQCVCLLF